MILTADVVDNLLAQKQCTINNAHTEDDEGDDENDENLMQEVLMIYKHMINQQQHKAIPENKGSGENRVTNEHANVVDGITNAACRASSEEVKKERRSDET